MLAFKTNYFYKDYKLPIWSSLLFAVIMLCLLLLRLYQQQSLANLLASKTSNKQDYATLLSNDKTASFNTTAYNNQPSQITTTPPNGNSVATSQPKPSTSSSSSNKSSSNSGGSSTGGGGSSSSGGGGSTSQPFAAVITDVKQNDSSPPSCLLGENCTVTLSFTAIIATHNGPASVSYDWHWSFYPTSGTTFGVPSDGSNSGSFDALDGDDTTQVDQSVDIDCIGGETYSGFIGIATTSPSPTSSNGIPSIHFTC